MTTVIHLNGRFITPPEEAVIPLLDRGYLLGHGVFATMRAYDAVCFRPELHLAELARGANLLDLTIPVPLSQIAALANEAAARTGLTTASVRVTLSPGALSIIARPTDLPTETDYTRGIAAVTVRPRRIPPACIDGTTKTTSYAAQVLARRDAESRGSSEGIQLAIDGSLACGTMANLFVVTGDALFTPSLESGCRAGVTRAAVMELAPRLGLRVHEQRLDTSALVDADEAFFTSTRIECLPIASVDGRTVGSGVFPRTHALRAALVALIHEATKRAIA